MISFFLLVLSLAHAEDRPSSLGFDSGGGSENYSSFGVNGRLGLDDVWQLQARGAAAKSGGDRSKYLNFGPNLQIGSDWNLVFLLQGSWEPNNVKSIGLAPGVNFLLSSLWDAERETNLFVGNEYNRYSNPRFLQRAYHFELAQEIVKTLEARANASFYQYNTPESTIRAAITRRTQATLNNSLVFGMPRDNFGLGLNWQANRYLDFGVEGSRSRSVDFEPRTRTLGGEVGLSIDYLPRISFNYSRSRTEGYGEENFYGFGFGLTL